MKTQVEMKRTLFGHDIRQQSQSEFFSATDLVKAGNEFRRKINRTEFNMTQFLNNKGTKEFIEEIEARFGKAVSMGRGRNAETWVHPLLFIDMALAIDPALKIEAYQWLFDNLLRFRNNSGDSYKEMSAALYTRYTNKKNFGFYISDVALQIQKACGVADWQRATENQLQLRDKIHNSIKTLCAVLTDTKEAVRIGIAENIKEIK